MSWWSSGQGGPGVKVQMINRNISGSHAGGNLCWILHIWFQIPISVSSCFLSSLFSYRIHAWKCAESNVDSEPQGSQDGAYKTTIWPNGLDRTRTKVHCRYVERGVHILMAMWCSSCEILAIILNWTVGLSAAALAVPDSVWCSDWGQ